MKTIFNSFTLIINRRTLAITLLSVLSTYFCIQFGIVAKFPDIMVSVAIVFPIVFSIGAAYSRRETALQRLADINGHAAALYYAARDWPTDPNNDLAEQIRQLYHEMMLLMKHMFRTTNDPNWPANEKKMYELFSRLSLLTMELKKYGVGGELSRLSQYVSKIIIAFDNLKVICRYRTPITLRTYSKVYIYAFAVIYGPYFASSAKDFSGALEYVMPVLYSFILVSLDNIQDHLENPFDGVGEDDIHLDVEDTNGLFR